MLEATGIRSGVPSHIAAERLLPARGGSQREARCGELLVISAPVVSMAGKMKSIVLLARLEKEGI